MKQDKPNPPGAWDPSIITDLIEGAYAEADIVIREAYGQLTPEELALFHRLEAKLRAWSMASIEWAVEVRNLAKNIRARLDTAKGAQ